MKMPLTAYVIVASMALAASAFALADSDTTADISPFCSPPGAKLGHLREGRETPPSGAQEINGVPNTCVTSDGYMRLDYPVAPRASMIDGDVM